MTVPKPPPSAHFSSYQLPVCRVGVWEVESRNAKACKESTEVEMHYSTLFEECTCIHALTPAVLHVVLLHNIHTYSTILCLCTYAPILPVLDVYTYIHVWMHVQCVYMYVECINTDSHSHCHSGKLEMGLAWGTWPLDTAQRGVGRSPALSWLGTCSSPAHCGPESRAQSLS